MYFTETSLTYNQLWMDRYDENYRFFRVRACSDAHIVLSTYSGSIEVKSNLPCFTYLAHS